MRTFSLRTRRLWVRILGCGLLPGVLLGMGTPAFSAPNPVTPAAPPTPAMKSELLASAAPDDNLPPLTEKMFYDILLADVALQRDDPILSAQTFLKLAKQTHSAWFAQRAAESALAARNSTLLKSALDLWEKYDPKAERPKRLREHLARLELPALSNNVEEEKVRAQLAKHLRDAEARGVVGAVLLQLNVALSQWTNDKLLAFDIVRDVTLPYSTMPEARYTVALAAFVAVNDKVSAQKPQIKEVVSEGISEINQALAVVPDWPEAAQLKILLLDAAGSPDLLPWLEGEVKRRPDEKSLWPFMARLLVKAQRLPEARAWFLKIWRDGHSDDALIATAAVTMQLKNDKDARALIEEVRQTGDEKQLIGALLTYANLCENDKRYDDAIYWLKQMPKGEAWMGAQLQIAGLLAKAGKNQEAQEWLEKLQLTTRDDRIQVATMRARLYRDQSAWGDARRVLESAQKAFPDSPELLLDLALTVEKQGDVTRAVALLREALALVPNSPLLQNALGYTLVDHRVAIDEGTKLIEQALAAMPNEGSILDSMGWALFRQQRGQESVDYLRRALIAQPDPEISAHLGEVLWSLGRHQEARSIWLEGIRRFAPNDSIIRTTMRRLKAAPPESDLPQPTVPHPYQIP